MLPDFVDGADIGMVQSGSSTSLAAESFQRLRILRDILGEELERHKSTKLRVLGLVDDTHTPAAQLLDDAVSGNGLADHWQECYGVRSGMSMQGLIECFSYSALASFRIGMSGLASLCLTDSSTSRLGADHHYGSNAVPQETLLTIRDEHVSCFVDAVKRKIMRHPLRKIALVGYGVVMSVTLAIIAEWVLWIKTPAAYLHPVLFPPLAGGSYDFRLVFLVLLGVDSIFFFAVLLAAYGLFTKLPDCWMRLRRGNHAHGSN